MSMYKRNPDIIIKNGTIVDGSGSMPYYADIAIKGDKIDFIGNLKDVDAPVIIDAHGKYVTPGFIDVHSHADMEVWANPEGQAAIRQGVTTEIVGNCGFSARNNVKKTAAFDPKGDGIKCVYDMWGEDEIPQGAMAAVLDKAEKMGTSENFAWLCGHNDLRVIAGVTTEECTKEQFDTMAGFLREAMEAGFIGFSTGLEFQPGVLSKPEEVIGLAKIAAEYDAHYTSHMRDEGTYLLEAVEEFLNVVRNTGMRGSVSHLNLKYDNGAPDEYLDKAMQMLKDAREKEHLNVMTDMLPTTFAPGQAMALLPSWLLEDGWDKAKEILATAEGRERVKADMNRYWRFIGAGQWDRLQGINASYWPEVSQTPFPELVKKWGKEPVDCFFDILMNAPTIDELRAVAMQGQVFHEQTMIDTVVKDPIYLWQTDSHTATTEGPLAKYVAKMHNFMSMMYFFTHYVRDLGVISIEQAVNKATSLAAKHFNLKKRGLLAEGYYADINVFDINELKINSTFSEPAKYCEGMDYVIVNGVPTIVKGEHVGARAGKILRNLPAK